MLKLKPDYATSEPKPLPDWNAASEVTAQNQNSFQSFAQLVANSVIVEDTLRL